MTLKEQVDAIITSLKLAHVDIKSALNDKGVSTSTFTTNEIGNLIRAIQTTTTDSGFNFMFDFRSIDQYGSPKQLLLGWATGGTHYIVPSMFNLQTGVLLDLTQVYSFPGINSYHCGTWGETTLEVTPSFNLTQPTLFNFNTTTLPGEFNYDDTITGS